MIKPYAVHVDRGFYGCNVYVPPIHLAFETEKAAREGYAKEIEMQKAEMAKTSGRPICDIQLIDMGNNKKVLLHDSFDKNGDIDLTPQVVGGCGWAREMDEALIKNAKKMWKHWYLQRFKAVEKKDLTLCLCVMIESITDLFDLFGSFQTKNLIEIFPTGCLCRVPVGCDGVA
jgi:hypothetical protein